MSGMKGYYFQEVKNDGRTVGCLKIEVSNIPQFNELLKKAQREACQLRETLDELSEFDLEIDFSVVEQTTSEI